MKLVIPGAIRVRDDECAESPYARPLLSMVQLEQMKSDVFDFGAAPKAILRFCADDSQKVFGRLKLRAGKLVYPAGGDPSAEIEMLYLVRKSKEQQFIACMEQWAFAGHPLLEEIVYPGEENTFNICLDEGNECFFGTDSQFYETLCTGLEKSWAAMHDNLVFWRLMPRRSLREKSIEEIINGPVIAP
jgi:hypothetical protein